MNLIKASDRRLAIIAFLLLAVLALGVIVVKNLPQEIKNCWTPEVPCMDLSGEQRSP